MNELDELGRQPAGKPKSTIERALSLFAQVNAGEGGTVLLLTLNALILMALYYILKPVREALILSQAGAEIKSYASAVQAILFVFLVPAYGTFASKVNRVWLLSGMTLFFASNLILFILIGSAGVKIGVAFYVWIGVFNFMIVSQFWAFANDIYSEEQGKRLFPIVGIGISFGALVGAQLTSNLIEPLGPYRLMFVACLMLGVFIVLIVAANRREAARSASAARQGAQALNAKPPSFSLIWQNSYLRLVAILVMLLNLVNTVGEFILGKLVESAAVAQIGTGEATELARSTFIGEFYGQYFFWTSLIAFLLQTFFVSRIIKYLDVRRSLFILPTISSIAYALTAAFPILSTVQYVKIAENSTDYSLNNTVRQALFLRTSREAKYKAKAAIDTFFGRTGDALQAVIVYGGTQLAFGVQAFALVNLVFVGIWFAVASGIANEHKKTTAEGQPAVAAIGG